MNGNCGGPGGGNGKGEGAPRPGRLLVPSLFTPIKCSHGCHLCQGGCSFLLLKPAQMLSLVGMWLAGLVKSGENLVLGSGLNPFWHDLALCKPPTGTSNVPGCVV